MPVIVTMLGGVNVGGHHLIKMEALRALYESLGLRKAETFIQSGNVVSTSQARDLSRLADRIANAIETKFGFRCPVILRTAAELREAIARTPFAGRPELDPARLLVTFLAAEPEPANRAKVLALDAAPEEIHLRGREAYLYFPNGIAKPKLPWATIGKMLQTPATARNWNTVRKLLEMAERLEASS